MNKEKRLSSDMMLWRTAFTVSKCSTCDRLHAGCVIARDGIIISTGFNGSAPSEPHCDDVGHDIVSVRSKIKDTIEEHCIRTIHAEVNAVINAAYLGVSVANADWYITGVPCQRCAKIISRLNPKSLFLVDDMGGVTDNKSKLIKWWYDCSKKEASPDFLMIKSSDELKELGVID